MDPTLSRSEAHRLFGNLYRKERSPELQEKVDAVVASTSDIFVRIRHIEELDAAEEERKRSERAKRGGPSAPVRGGGGGGGTAVPAGPVGKKAGDKDSGGLFARLFGGPLVAWGAETRTLQTGLFGLNLRLDPAVQKVFHMEEAAVGALSKVFRVLGGNAYDFLEPARFNLVMAAYQFFSEFVKAETAFRTSEGPEEWLIATLKMQKLYAQMIKYPDYQRVLVEDIPEVALRYDPIKAEVPAATKLLGYIANLDVRKPTLRNCILAHYALARKEVPGWEVVEKDVQAREPELDRYRAPQQVIERIYARIAELQGQIQERESSLNEIDSVRKRFFSFDEKGRIRIDFLVPIVAQTLKQIQPKAAIPEATVRAQMQEPHRLLYLLVRDIDLNYVNVLSGSVGLKSGAGHPEDVLLFKQGLFRKHVDDLNFLMRLLDSFYKKNVNFHYTFTDLMRDTRKAPEADTSREFVSIVGKCNRWFASLAKPLGILISNHDDAVRAEQQGKLNESVKRTAVLAIEGIGYERRFLPFYDRTLAISGRLADKSVYDALLELTQNLYNFLYIFRDEDLHKLLGSEASLRQDVATLQGRLQRMGVGPEQSQESQKS